MYLAEGNFTHKYGLDRSPFRDIDENVSGFQKNFELLAGIGDQMSNLVERHRYTSTTADH